MSGWRHCKTMRNKSSVFVAYFSMMVGLSIFSTHRALAETPMEAGTVEVVGFGGMAAGLPSVAGIAQELRGSGLPDFTVHDTSKVKVLGGGGIGVALNKYALVFGDFVYNRFSGGDVS